jgi:hypothetical protein
MQKNPKVNTIFFCHIPLIIQKNSATTYIRRKDYISRLEGKKEKNNNKKSNVVRGTREKIKEENHCIARCILGRQKKGPHQALAMLTHTLINE